MAEVASKKKILIGVSGSVATVKIAELAKLLSVNHEVKIVCTKCSQHFFDKNTLPESVQLLTDEDEWSTFKKIGDPVLHIELRRWADIAIVAPLSANTMAKLAAGMCDNLLTCIARAWDMSKPFLVAPAMNTHMWDHPLTARHISTLQSLNYIIIPPIAKKLACGDIGMGAMATVDDIVLAVETELLNHPKPAPHSHCLEQSNC
eukprot:TRINITY_DN11773_c0_g1::TRINITY_DN11773_c0_g1_i1::g.11581::m.11581 TRINITY_DN11773_c0_g1::TRINITY_DN11773_c0_g1_i1::g.11581  ORF type:complete len:204 (+),score=8.77,sp/P94063/HAL3B_ARATH/62.72/2e-72,Flavoprotein/PF02441.14/3e-44 TRINITY_DN11773_c0_g1_i1:75-686(+)